MNGEMETEDQVERMIHAVALGLICDREYEHACRRAGVEARLAGSPILHIATASAEGSVH